MSNADNDLPRVGICYIPFGMDLAAVRQQLRAERKARRWSLDDLAGKSGVNRSTIHDIEQNRHGKPQLETVAKLIEGMGLSLGEFFASLEKSTVEPILRLSPPSHQTPLYGRAPVSAQTEDINATAVTIAIGERLIDLIDQALDRAIAAREQVAATRMRTTTRTRHHREAR